MRTILLAALLLGSSAALAADPPLDPAARLKALEKEVAALRVQADRNAARAREIEEELARLRPAAARPAPEAAPAPAVAPTGDPAEDAYMAGYRLWEQGRYREAAKALEAVASKYPRHRRASYALNLAGRAYLDAGNATAAAQLFLQNYRNDKKGERAQDSLYYLGQSLMRLGKPAEACRVYRQLRTEYGPSLRDLLEQRLSQALADAKCPA